MECQVGPPTSMAHDPESGVVPEYGSSSRNSSKSSAFRLLCKRWRACTPAVFLFFHSGTLTFRRRQPLMEPTALNAKASARLAGPPIVLRAQAANLGPGRGAQRRRPGAQFAIVIHQALSEVRRIAARPGNFKRELADSLRLSLLCPFALHERELRARTMPQKIPRKNCQPWIRRTLAAATATTAAGITAKKSAQEFWCEPLDSFASHPAVCLRPQPTVSRGGGAHPRGKRELRANDRHGLCQARRRRHVGHGSPAGGSPRRRARTKGRRTRRPATTRPSSNPHSFQNRTDSRGYVIVLLYIQRAVTPGLSQHFSGEVFADRRNECTIGLLLLVS